MENKKLMKLSESLRGPGRRWSGTLNTRTGLPSEGNIGKHRDTSHINSILDDEPYLWAVIRYIEQNPVRAKLIKKAEDYQWSSARAHILGR
jgi:hypothetical protein